jgi:PIN domain nuclease of toxin-antitoxin system
VIVADTHAWIWWMSADLRLSEAGRRALDTAGSVGIAAASCWELAWLEANGRITLRVDLLDLLRAAFKEPRIALVPLTPEIAVRGARLGRHFPRDPADRQIVATALHVAAPLVTRDGPITASGLVETIW